MKRASLLLACLAACAFAREALVSNVVPVEASNQVFSHVHANYRTEGNLVVISIGVAPGDVGVGTFHGFSFRVLNHAVKASTLSREYFDWRTLLRREVSDEPRFRIVLEKAEVPRSYLAVRYLTPRNREHDDVVFCIPIQLVIEACDRRAKELLTPNLRPSERSPSSSTDDSRT